MLEQAEDEERGDVQCTTPLRKVNQDTCTSEIVDNRWVATVRMPSTPEEFDSARSIGKQFNTSTMQNL